mmetsp:Transcript_4063/g.8701  ORF Transcript_4063/g.8701 Transcript_4063/m.8701 type:complete len:536 (+) Transcript_4063:79-1686(+)
MNSQSTTSIMSSTIIHSTATANANANATANTAAMVANEASKKPQKRQREEPHFDDEAEESHNHGHVNYDRPCPRLVQQNDGNMNGRSSSFKCGSNISSDSSFQLMRNNKLQALQAEAGVLHSNIGAALHRYIVANQECSDSSSDAGNSAEKFLETCLNHYKQAVKFHTLALSILSRDASLEEMQQTQDHVNEMHGKLSWIRSTLCPSSVTFYNSKSSSSVPSANGQNLHFFTDILLSMERCSQSEGSSQLLFLALFNMSTLHYTHYIKQKGKGCDNEVKNAFSTEEGANKLSINEAAQMCYLLLSKALSLLQSMDEKRENSDTFSFGALKNSEYAMMVQNNMAVLLSDVFGRHGEALECLEDVVFWVLGEDDEGEQTLEDDSGDEVANAFNSTEEVGISVGESCRRVSVSDDDSFESLDPIARSKSRCTSSLRTHRKAVLLFNSSRIHYRCGLYQDAAELYRQYSSLIFPVVSFSNNNNHVDDFDRVESCDGIVVADGKTQIGSFRGSLDVVPSFQDENSRIEEFATGCNAAAAA